MSTQKKKKKLVDRCQDDRRALPPMKLRAPFISSLLRGDPPICHTIHSITILRWFRLRNEIQDDVSLSMAMSTLSAALRMSLITACNVPERSFFFYQEKYQTCHRPRYRVRSVSRYDELADLTQRNRQIDDCLVTVAAELVAG